MKSFSEYKELVESVQHSIDELDNVLTDELLDTAEQYDIEYDETKGQHRVSLYDSKGAVLATALVNDPIDAEEYLSEFFDLEEYDADDVDDDTGAGASRFGHAD